MPQGAAASESSNHLSHTLVLALEDAHLGSQQGCCAVQEKQMTVLCPVQYEVKFTIASAAIVTALLFFSTLPTLNEVWGGFVDTVSYLKNLLVVNWH